MLNHCVSLCNSHDIVIYLIALECDLSLLCLSFFAHWSPNVCEQNVSVLCSLKRNVCHWELVAIALGKFKDFSSRLIILGASDRNFHAYLKSTNDKRVCHVVAVAYVAHFQTLEASLELSDGHKVSKHLTRVAEVCQTVYYRDRAIFSKILNLFLLKSTDHDAVKVTWKNTGCVLNRLASAYLEVTVWKEKCLTAKLIHTCFKRNSCTGRGLLEYHSESFAFKNVVLDTIFVFVFELVCKIENVENFLLGKVEHFK